MFDPAPLARLLDRAAAQATPVAQLSQSSSFDLQQAYEIQRQLIQLRLDRGERMIGVKLGFTSLAKARQMGVSDIIHGRLTDAMLIEDGGLVELARYCHPRVEPELAVRLNAPLAGEVGYAQAYDAIEAVAPAIELIDSRYRDFKFSLVDVVADNASSSGVVIGPWAAKPAALSDREVLLSFDGDVVQRGSTADVMGDPVLALMAAARMLGEAGERLEAGWTVMTGGATAAQALTPGIEARSTIAALGDAGLRTA